MHVQSTVEVTAAQLATKKRVQYALQHADSNASDEKSFGDDGDLYDWEDQASVREPQQLAAVPEMRAAAADRGDAEEDSAVQDYDVEHGVYVATAEE
jgi:hypothetical protein